jgi:hypothetical protein
VFSGLTAVLLVLFEPVGDAAPRRREALFVVFSLSVVALKVLTALGDDRRTCLSIVAVAGQSCLCGWRDGTRRMQDDAKRRHPLVRRLFVQE